MSYRLNITEIYCINDREYRKNNIPKEEKVNFSGADIRLFNKFRHVLTDKVGTETRVVMKVYPKNEFKAFDLQGKEIFIQF